LQFLQLIAKITSAEGMGLHGKTESQFKSSAYCTPSSTKFFKLKSP